jgi:protein-S-isoprenylcysteine O-methyltransferase Ste14
LARAAAAALKVLGLFLILEPLWMLLPFAGFLYGSVMQIETLARSPATAWLTHFVFPVLTAGWLGPLLAALGLALFLVGAAQIYWAKIRRSGLVTKGPYRLVRHPQYVALVLFGFGILLTWGRAITFLAFFTMLFLYYHLARSEERSCLRLFGQEYERYRERTSFIIPGDRLLRPLRARLPRVCLPAPLRVAGALAGTMVSCLVLMGLIDTVKTAVRTVPYLTATVAFGGPQAPGDAADLAIRSGEGAGVPFVQAGRVAVVRGPYRNAWVTGFAERVLLRLRKILDRLLASARFRHRLRETGAGDRVVAVAFPAPGPNWYHEHHGMPEIGVFVILVRLREGAAMNDLFALR